jgi:YVTN family beta-propeller protein
VTGASSFTLTPVRTGGKDTYTLALSPNGKTVYAVNYSSNSVTPVNTATDTAGTPIKVGKQPEGIAITP